MTLSAKALALSGKAVKDRRIQKTQGLLHEALISLIHEKSYDAIAVQEILDRANVGRSTFYMHFRDKDELFVSGIHEMLRAVQVEQARAARDWPETVVWFSLPILEHIYMHRREHEARMGARGRALLLEHLRHVLAEWIAADVEKELQTRGRTANGMSSELLRRYVVSTFLFVLTWWVDGRSPLPPKDVDELFRSLVLPSLAARSR